MATVNWHTFPSKELPVTWYLRLAGGDPGVQEKCVPCSVVLASAMALGNEKILSMDVNSAPKRAFHPVSARALFSVLTNARKGPRSEG